MPKTTARMLPTNDGEEIVDARSSAPQPVQALKLKGQWYEPGDEGQDVEVVLERRACPW